MSYTPPAGNAVNFSWVGVPANYTIPTEHPGEHTVVVYPVTGENLPALVHHGVIPI